MNCPVVSVLFDIQNIKRNLPRNASYIVI